MATQVQFRRGTTAETALFTGAVGEVTVDINKDTCVVHDGFTQGGFPLLREDGSNMALSTGSVTNCSLKFVSDPNTGIISPGPDQISFVTGGVIRLGIDSSGAASFANNVSVGGNLSVTGSISLAGPVSFAAGSAAAPSITFTGDTNTGIYSPGADQLGFTTGGVSRFVIDASGDTSLTGHLNIASTKEYKINNTKVIDATSLGSAVVSSSLTSVGTVTTGTWQATAVTHGYGGTGHTSYTNGQLLIGKTDGSLAKTTLTAGTNIAVVNGDGLVTLNVADGTTTQKGVVQLEDSTSSTSTTTAATPNSVKSAYDLANAALPKSGGTLTGDLTLNAQSDLRFADADSSNWVAFQAPATVATNITWTLPNADGAFGQVLRTNGSGILSWVTGGGGGGASVTTSDTPPATPNDGDLWYDSASGRMYVYYDDGTTSQWVDASPQGLVSVITSDTAPTSPNDGAFWYDSVGGRTYIYYNDGNTTQWVDASPQQTGPQTSIASGNTTAQVTDTGSDGRFVVTTEGTERLRVDSSGRVGIGTTSPGSELEIFKGSASDVVATVKNTAGEAYACYLTSGGDVLTGLKTSGNYTIRINNTERARIDSSGRLLVGTSTAVAATTLTPGFQHQGTEGSFANAGFGRWTNDNGGYAMYFAKSRGISVGSQVIVNDGDFLGALFFEGSDGTQLRRSASITANVDGTPGANDMPGRLVFSTTADGASSPTERMRIAQNGVITIQNGAVAVIGTLTDGATITPDLAADCNFTVTLGGNRTIANPTNITAGQSGSIFIVQDGTGSRLLSWGSFWDFPGGTAPTLTTTANAIDRVDYIVRSATSIQTVFTANYS